MPTPCSGIDPGMRGARPVTTISAVPDSFRALSSEDHRYRMQARAQAPHRCAVLLARLWPSMFRCRFPRLSSRRTPSASARADLRPEARPRQIMPAQGPPSCRMFPDRTLARERLETASARACPPDKPYRGGRAPSLARLAGHLQAIILRGFGRRARFVQIARSVLLRRAASHSSATIRPNASTAALS